MSVDQKTIEEAAERRKPTLRRLKQRIRKQLKREQEARRGRVS